MFEKEGFSSWFKENTPKEGFTDNTTFTIQFLIDAWNNGYNKAKEELKNSDELYAYQIRDFQLKCEQFTKEDEAKTIIQDLLSNSDEYARQRAMDWLKEE